ncbi:MAG: TIGR04282 family arsenosugar biosynthesis glycosyltransferase [Verrucomicrobiae bacterium]|nr:TIGR04282 family arsenosugar biosynthesis glycosyltransferase [Verrucomicrobiae bacterium]
MEVVALFLKAPVPGQVKTRLAASLGDEKASEAYVSLVEFLLKRLSGLPIHIHHVPEDSSSLVAWLGPDYVYHPQKGADLGERLENAMECEFAGGADKLIFLGGDCPYVDKSRIDEAFAALDHHDVVIGPATDGGYYLIGLKHLLPELFRNIAWSTDVVFKQTLEICYRDGFSFSVLAEESDVDDLASWEKASAFLQEQASSS